MHILGEFYLKKIPIRVKKDRNFINALLVKKFLLSRKHKSKMNITLFLALLSCFYKSGEKFERCPSNWNEIEDKSSKPSKLKTGIIIMIVIIVLLFLISIICPNVNGFTLAKVKRKKVEDEEVPFQKPAAPEQQDDDWYN